MEEPGLKIESFEYVFYLPDGDIRKYLVEINKKTRTLSNFQMMQPDSVDWTNLTFHQCSICPLDETKFPKCPVAWNLHSIIETFGDQISFQEVDVEIIANQRTYKKSTTLQIGLQSLFGLLMASSNCPKLHFLSSMTLFHLPFASFEETILRAASFYLLKQFFNKSEEKEYNFSMDGLKQQYEEVETVNQDFLGRIQAIEMDGDASLNAINTLNAFAQMFSLQYEINLESLHYIFK